MTIVRVPLALRASLAVVIPLTVAGIGPWLVAGRAAWHVGQPWRLVFLLPMAAGAALLFTCIVLFAVAGGGTLAPVDPPTHFVAVGPYRFTRNPMYVGVTLWLVGQALLTSVGTLVWYACIVPVGFHLFVRLVEEPSLRRRFGDAYDTYTQRVPRWLGHRRGT